MKRITSMLLSCALLLGMLSFSGCSGSGNIGNNNSSSSGTKPSDSSVSTAVEWPKGTVTITCAFGAGGDNDATARLAAEWLTEYFGETFVVVNVTGAGGATAAIEVMGKEPDGYNILATEGTTDFGMAMGTLDFSYSEDLKCIASYALGCPGVLVCRADNKYGWKNFEDVLTYIKDHPGEVTISDVAGTSTSMTPIVMEVNGYVTKRLDVGTSGTDRIAALLGGQVDLMNTGYLSLKDYIADGTLIPLATNGPDGINCEVEMPKMEDFGLADSQNPKYYKMYFPKDTPQEIVDKMEETLKIMSSDSKFVEKLEAMYGQSNFMSGAEADAYQVQEIERFGKYKEYLLAG